VTSLVVLSLLAGVPLPQECEPPPLHDVAPLKTFAQKSGTLSVGLDSVATWCFDSGGVWTGGQRPEPGKKPKPIDPKAPPVGDCARALTACEDARVALTGDLMQTLLDALGDLERPYRGQKYPPKRTGLNERPPTNVNCKERSRPDLFAQAQARMDLARLASTVQNEYANYKTWLFARGLECAQQVKAGRVDNTRVAISLDTPAAPVTAGGAAGKGTGGGAGTTVATPTGPTAPTGTSGTTGTTGTTAAGTGATTKPASAGSTTSASAGGTTPGTTPTGTGATTKPASGGSTTTASAGGTTPGTTGTTTTGAAGTTGTAVPSTTPGSALVAANTGTSKPATGSSGAGTTSTTTPGTSTGAPNTGTSPTTANPSGTPDIGAAPVLPPPVVTTTPSGTIGTTGTPAGTTGTTATTVASTTPGTTGPSANPLGTPGETAPAPVNAMLETWRSLASQRAKMELDRDYTLGFLASRELRDCRCQRSSPAGIVTRIESGEATAQLEADNQRAVACEHCLQNAFAAWRGRVQKQCSLMGELSEYELEVLQRSDDGNGIPPRCWQEIVSRRGLDAGVFLATPTVTAKPPPVQTTMTVPLPVADAGTKTLVAAGPVQPISPPPTGMPRFEPTSTLADGFFRPNEPAPIPLREDGRLYVRVFMSSTCAADVLPGPVLARTGDLLLIPYGARQLSLRSPCGGLAEVYWGREPTPRVSEVFGRNQPLHLQFKPQ
jgi:hypothetical protein